MCRTSKLPEHRVLVLAKRFPDTCVHETPSALRNLSIESVMSDAEDVGLSQQAAKKKSKHV